MSIFKDIRMLAKATVNLSGYIDTEAAEKNIRSNIYFRGPNAWILAIATIIASVGLNVNSIPVVIGAMLISPLMGPIFGLGLSLGVNDVKLLKSSGKNLLVMVTISLIASFLYFLITPLSLNNPTELLARTNPTIYDVLIALFGGFAGIVEQCRKEKGTVFSGVAIATALMPPLCTAGYGLAGGHLGYFFGALYLFFINCLFIMLATYLSVKYFKFRQTEYEDQATGKKTKRISSILILIFIIPSIWSAVTLIKQNNFEANATAFAEHSKAYGKSIIYDYKIDHTDGSTIELFFTGDALNEDTKAAIYKAAEEYELKAEQILINDHSSNDSSNHIELVKGIYDKMDSEIADRDATIKRLEEELKAAKGTDIPYVKITRELSSVHPGIKSLTLTQGADIQIDSLKQTPATIAIIKADSTFNADAADRIEQWLKVRLEKEDITLFIHTK